MSRRYRYPYIGRFISAFGWQNDEHRIGAIGSSTSSRIIFAVEFDFTHFIKQGQRMAQRHLPYTTWSKREVVEALLGASCLKRMPASWRKAPVDCWHRFFVGWQSWPEKITDRPGRWQCRGAWFSHLWIWQQLQLVDCFWAQWKRNGLRSRMSWSHGTTVFFSQRTANSFRILRSRDFTQAISMILPCQQFYLASST